MAAPTRDDAQLIVQLAGVGAQLELGKATSFIWSDEFVSDYGEFKKRFPPGSKELGRVNSLAGWHETIATLVKHGLLSEELVHDWLALGMTWKRLEGVLVGMREEAGEPRLYENFEALAGRVPVPA